MLLELTQVTWKELANDDSDWTCVNHLNFEGVPSHAESPGMLCPHTESWEHMPVPQGAHMGVNNSKMWSMIQRPVMMRPGGGD